MHGPRGSRRKQSDYAIALGEKQKLRYQYGLLERQFRRIFRKALQKRGVTGETRHIGEPCAVDAAYVWLVLDN